MRKVIIIIGALALSACSSTRFVDSWKNEEISSFHPEKILVVGITDNLTARNIFESELKSEFMKRNINAVKSVDAFEAKFTDSKKNEEEIDAMVEKLSINGFDAVIITAVKGINKVRNYTPDYYTVDYRWTRFGRYYYRFQDIYYTPRYYNEYKVYNIETSIYNINEGENKSLVWVGAFDIVDPESITITTTINDYVDRIIKQLQYEKIIKKP